MKKGWLRILVFFIPYSIILGLFTFAGSKVANYNIYDLNLIPTTRQDLILIIFDFIGTFLVLWFSMKYIDREKFHELGFQINNRLIDFIFGLTLGISIISISFYILYIIDSIFIISYSIDMTKLFQTTLIFILVAVIEETIFRGYILRNLLISFKKHIALLISSIFFAFMHGLNPNINNIGFLDLFLAGILLGISYIYTRNLWFPIGLHISWNLTQTLLGFNVSGQDIYSIVEIQIKENNLLNGGDFGFEGSILSVISQLFFIALIFFYYRKQEKLGLLS